MNIGIIGSGQIGGTLTRRFRAVGHEVAVANSRGPASLAQLAQETGARAVSLDEVVRSKDVVVVAVPINRIPDLPSGLFAASTAAMVIIDASNYYPQQRDGRIAGIEDGLTESGWVEQQLGRPVVKAFNTILAEHLLDGGKPAGAAGRIALAVAGDDPIAKAAVMRLIDQIGFDTVDAGPIEESWRQQPGSPGYLRDLDIAGVRQALAEAVRDRGADWRATANSPGPYDSPA